ncbi:MAG: NYN domain-containing protein [Oscillospiraceae bacterium]
MNEDKKLALLIDSDNVSAKYAPFILQEASKYGELTYKRVYGDWEKGGNGWHYPALNNSILPVQQMNYIAGKNCTDFSMIIDAMDILYTGNVDGFVLVTSDSDFTRLAIRLREAGKLVVGIGEVKTPLPFTASCHHFSYLNQVCEPNANYDEKALRKAVLDYVSDNDDGRLDLAKISAYLTSKFGNIDYDAFGFKRFSNFIDSFSELRRSNTFVTLKKKDSAKAVEERKPAPQSEPSASELVSVITEYLERKHGRDDLSQLEKFVTGVFGKVDYSRFGSKRFARFIDSQPQFVRRNSMVVLAETVEKTEPEKPASAVTLEAFSEDVLKYAGENMPNGGNLGQLNNLLIEKYGKNYVAELGFDDFAKAVLSVTQVKVSKNHVFSKNEDTGVVETVAEEKQPEVKQPAKKLPEKQPEEKQQAEPAPEKPKKQKPEKLELNTVKREVQMQTAQSEKGVTLPALGKLLKEKFGENYLKELGIGSVKKLISGVAGVKISGNYAKMSKEFVERTEQIEQLVRDFVENSKKPSVKALSTHIKKNFEDFDFTDYGYARFSDFINAIDGVRADGYYVEKE